MQEEKSGLTVLQEGRLLKLQIDLMHFCMKQGLCIVYPIS